ncbi:MAG TPA: ATPase [Deltaproteobacteria bacterium]|nr:ATPase [Deltaproteobacteria bacterium]
MIQLNWTFFVQMVNFLVLMFILDRILYRPILKILDERDKKIETGQEKAKELLEKSEYMLKDYKEKISDAKVEALEIKNSAIKEAEEEANRIINDGRKKAEQILEEIKADAERQVETARKELESEVGAIASSIVNQVLGREVTQ